MKVVQQIESIRKWFSEPRMTQNRILNDGDMLIFRDAMESTEPADFRKVADVAVTTAVRPK